MRGLIAYSTTAFVLLWLWAPPPPPPPVGRPPAPDPAKHVENIRGKLSSAKAIDRTAQRALAYSHNFLSSAEISLRSGQLFRADRLAAAADALLHVAEHQQHLRLRGGPKGAPPPDAIQDHLQRVYFRTQQADYFLNQSHDPRAHALPQWARAFYQLAVRDSERNDRVAADENAKSSDDIVRALENLALAANVSGKKQADKPGP